MSGINCIVYPPTVDYHYMTQRPQQLMNQFARMGIPVFFMNQNTSFRRPFRGIEKVAPNLFVFHEVDPLPFLQGVRPVVYYNATAHVEQVQRFHPSLLVFDSVDEPSEEFAAWRPYYNRAVSSADLVLCSSAKLQQMAGPLNSHVYLVKNGCDYEHFSRAREDLPVPREIQEISGPVIGYFGVIATWCDLELVERVARAFPHCQLLMIGPLYNVSRVPQRENIHWLGYRPYDQLPGYARLFDVAIIPFRHTSMTEAVNPIKMWEYMAAGIPVVSTNLPEARAHQNLVYCARTGDEFMEGIRAALADKFPERRQERMALARENSWEARAHDVLDLLRERLAIKDPGSPTGVPMQPVPYLQETVEGEDEQKASHIHVNRANSLRLSTPVGRRVAKRGVTHSGGGAPAGRLQYSRRQAFSHHILPSSKRGYKDA